MDLILGYTKAPYMLWQFKGALKFVDHEYIIIFKALLHCGVKWALCK